MNAFEGKAALVTGGAKGIGRATAEALHALGAGVAILDLDDPGIEGVVATTGDVSRAADVERAVAAATDAYGRLDVLVCSAGIQRYGTAPETDEQTWDEVLAVNLKGMYLAARAAIPVMERGEGGAIVNVASVQGLAAQRGVAAYAASKGGVISFTKALAVDHAPRVRANAVLPGSVDTPMLRDAAATFGDGDVEATVRSWGAMHPMDRVARASEVAEAICFLASPAASFVTGAALLVDGGLLSIIGGT